MEIAPVPHRTSRSEWRRLALGLLLLTPLVLLVLLPAVVGLDRSVTTDPEAPDRADRGSVVLSRQVAPSDLAVGDVITFADPRAATGRAGDRLTREIVALDGGVATTAGGVQVPLDDGSYARVCASFPWIGYPFVMDGGWAVMTLAVLGVLALGALVSRRRDRRRRDRRPAAFLRLPAPRLPVA